MDEDKLKQNDFLKDVSKSIGEQVEKEEEKNKVNKETEQKESSDLDIDKSKDKTSKAEGKEEDSKEAQEEEAATEEDSANAEGSESSDKSALENYMSEPAELEPPAKKKWSWKKKLLIVLSIIVILAGGAFGFVWYMVSQIQQDQGVEYAPTDLTDEELKEQEESLVTPSFDTEIESKVVNILLIGEEAMDDDVGRSDSIMIATINTEEKSLKLTSLLRDTYVTIPGYMNNKLNAAYHNGGGELLTEVVELNFNVKIDGYVRVDYEGFEDIIDELGGVEIDIQENEAEYLNSTNYISKASNRNLTVGLQTLNGDQALGYCRVRYRKTSSGATDDFGRTERQRTVLTALFNKYKSTSIVNMVSIASNLLSNYVSTNMTKTEIIKYITVAASLGTTELETMHVPVDGSYTSESLNCGGTYREVLNIDFDLNNTELRNFIYAGLDEADLSEELEDDDSATDTESSESTDSSDSSDSSYSSDSSTSGY